MRYVCIVAIAAALVCTSAGPTFARSIRLNNYNNWTPKPGLGVTDATLTAALAKLDALGYSEYWNTFNLGISPAALKALNPGISVYRVCPICCKGSWDSDWKNPDDTSTMDTPVTKAEIDRNGWWLRDAEDNIVKEGSGSFYLDVGKPGFKELYLRRLLDRNAGKGFDGFVFDLWWPNVSSLFGVCNAKWPPKGYRSDEEWFEKAWKPFAGYVMEGMRKAGYRLIGNMAGEYQEGVPRRDWQRSLLDGVVYEQFAVDWPKAGGAWLRGEVVERRIRAFRSDPLEAWVGEYGAQYTLPEFDQKRVTSLAMYYIAVPTGRTDRSYHYYGDSKVFWDPLWDFDIGEPSGLAVKRPGKFVWSRPFTGGIVLMNYEATESASFNLAERYRDHDGKSVSGRLVLPPHTSAILQRTKPSP